MWQRILTVCLCFVLLGSIAQAGSIVNEATAAKTGQMLGAQLLISGVISEFEEKADAGGIGGLSFAGVAGGVKFSQAHVAVDIRVFDTTSGVILQAHTADKKATKVGFAIAGFGKGGGLSAGWETKTPLGKATRDAIGEIVNVIVEQSEKLPWQASIVTVKSDAAYINIGQKDGLETKTVFDVYRPEEELIDPETGLSLGSEETKIGQIELTEVKEKFSVAKIKQGSGFVKGDIVRLTDGKRKYTPKKRIAVTGFECNVPSGSYDLGSAMSEMLITSLVATNKFIVVERKALDDILKEQSLGKETLAPVKPLPTPTPEAVIPATQGIPSGLGNIMARCAAAYFGYAFYAGGYWLGANPFQPGEWTKWKVMVDNDVHEMEKAFLTRTGEGKEWWRVSFSSGKKAKEENIFEGLFSAERSSLRRLKGKFSDQEPGEIPVTEGSIYQSPMQLTPESIKGATVGEEIITVDAGKFVTQHAIYNVMGSGSSEWWLNNDVPGGVVKYLYKTPKGKIEYVAELKGWGNGAATILNSY
jgi:curli biogenesis system outer membrane secretion channel CsgG